MSFGLLGFPREPKPDPVTAATQQWLDKEGRAEQSARAALLELQVRYGDLDSELVATREELRERNRMYGRASTTIGALRGDVARLRAEREQPAPVITVDMSEAQRQLLDTWQRSAAMQRHPSGAVDPADTAKVGDLDPTPNPSGDCEARLRYWYCTRDSHRHGQHVAGTGRIVVAVWPNDADAALVATAERLGDEAGQRIVNGVEARELAVGAVIVSVEALTRYDHLHALVRVNSGWWHPLHGAHDLLADDGRFSVLYVPGTSETREVRPVGQRDEAGQRDRQAAIDGAAVTLRAHMHRQAHSWGSDRCACGWWGPDHVQHVAEQLAATGALGDLGPKLPAPRPTPRTGSFASGEKRTFADGDD